MKNISQYRNTFGYNPVRWIFFGLAFVTLYFQTNLADPFNSPKQWVLLFFSSWLVGYIFAYRKIIFSIKPLTTFYYLVVCFLAFELIATILSKNHYLAVFGATMRKNGFISYLSLAVIVIATALFLSSLNINLLFFTTTFIGTLTVIYALMQASGNDFIAWNNPYNPVITTLGNPNFSAAVMAIIGVITFSSILIPNFHSAYRIFCVFLTLLLLISIYRTNARQGLLSFVLGLGLFLIIWVFNQNKKIGVMVGLIGLFVLTLSILGILQRGPLEKYLYKETVSIRGFYWQAGLAMFRQNPLFGVGIDSYELYFKQYRDVAYPLKYGYQITSSNAHNTFIQFFATGGFGLGLSYVLLNGFILKCAITSLSNLAGHNKLKMAGIFSAWISFHAQSLVSIDNLGISIWGWILGGAIIGMSVSATQSSSNERKIFSNKAKGIDATSFLFSAFTSLVALVLITLLYRGESNAFKVISVFSQNDQESNNLYRDLNVKAINTFLIDPSYSIIASQNLIKSGFLEEGLNSLKQVLANNPRNLDALNLLASAYEQLGNISEANRYRREISYLDPWNALNYLQLGKNYKEQENFVGAREMLDKILSFATNDSISNEAKLVLSGDIK